MRHNLEVARAHAPRSRTWCVVKANAYGHSLVRALRAFDQSDGLALIEPEAAQQLRELGWVKPILLLEGCFDMDDVVLAQTRNIQVAVHCREQIEMIERSPLAEPLDVHLKMNSGMNRLGFVPAEYRQAHARLQACAKVRSIALMTHFANADDPANPGMPFAHQLRNFLDATDGLPGARNLANSAADLLHPQACADWVRPGIMLYGGTPGMHSAEYFGLRPAMTLRSQIISVQTVAPGGAVGYGSRFVAKETMRIGVVACGYADGYPRHAPDGTPVLVNGARTGIVGRVSMDMLMVDLTRLPDAGMGSEVVLWGDGLPIDEVAAAAGTIGYELMCALAPRVRVVETGNAPI
ncbi:alanine racemase [Noviherbaspirillum humi]|uniref:Alanine racemase n=2 Tax=Noviherbaspirillum humi TaxID=1688639 RepID=A0A239FZ66_9BURK|nr:alanine racemase [Noviherbaspirillum humi]